jgi:hypothetical protein
LGPPVGLKEPHTSIEIGPNSEVPKESFWPHLTREAGPEDGSQMAPQMANYSQMALQMANCPLFPLPLFPLPSSPLPSSPLPSSPLPSSLVHTRPWPGGLRAARLEYGAPPACGGAGRVESSEAYLE